MAFQQINEFYKRPEGRSFGNYGKEKISYTTLIHQAREVLGVSVIEYCVADSVHKFGGSPKNRELGGWCSYSKQHIATCLGVNKRTIERALNNLIKKELIEKDPETKHLRTTEHWYITVESYKERLRRS